ncbi:Casein kinase (serine/threonine/tyrosine protein kinase), partial [Trachipleistophora hominis]
VSQLVVLLFLFFLLFSHPYHKKPMNDFSDIQITHKLGTGTFGDVYAFLDCKTNRKMALKIEKKNCNLLRNEYKIYVRLNRTMNDFVCRTYFYGKVRLNNTLNNAMVMDLLGLSLQKLFIRQHKRFSEVTVLRLGIMMISCVEFLHARHFVHRDIKPDNFVFGLGANSDKLYLIDLGLAKKYRSSTTYTHIPHKNGKLLVGTARYASVNVHRGEEQSRRDDLESLGYCLIFFVKGKLPWQGLKASNKQEKHMLIREVKESVSLEVLCEGLHGCFYEYMKYVRSLNFKTMPDYDYVKQLFEDALYEMGHSGNTQFDWSGSE